jgi:DnaK suppressor protein
MTFWRMPRVATGCLGLVRLKCALTILPSWCVALKHVPVFKIQNGLSHTIRVALMPSAAAASIRKNTKANPAAPVAGALLTEAQLRAMPESDYMNDAQLEFFRGRLMEMRDEILQRQSDVRQQLHEHELFADPADRATAEEEHALALRLRERESVLLAKIEQSLRRIHDREYGYCVKTGDAIGIPRLLARPTATVCVQVKDYDEKVETHYRSR